MPKKKKIGGDAKLESLKDNPVVQPENHSREEKITTGVDQLVDLLNETGKISIRDAADRLNVPEQTVEDWAVFLEEEGIVTFDYRLTKVFIVKKTKPEEKREQEKAFTIEKGAFKNRSESLLSYFSHLERQIRYLNDMVNKIDIKNVSLRELDALKRLESEKNNTDIELMNARHGIIKKLKIMEESFEGHKSKLAGMQNELMESIVEADDVVNLEKKELDMIGKNERELEKKLTRMDALLNKKVLEITSEKSSRHLRAAERLHNVTLHYNRLKKELLQDKERLSQLLKDNDDRERAIRQLRNIIIKKIQKYSQKIKSKTPEQVQEFLRKRAFITGIMSRLYHEEQLLKSELMRLIGKGKSMNIERFSQFEGEINSLGKELSKLSTRRSIFDKSMSALLDKLKSKNTKK